MMHSHNFKIGDKVIVRPNLKTKIYDHLRCNSTMSYDAGQILTIKSLADPGTGKTSPRYTVQENGWTWNEEMFIALTTKISINPFFIEVK